MTKNNRVRRWPLLCFPWALCAGATACNAAPAFVQASRATYDAIAPEYLGYVTADPVLSQEAKDRRALTVRLWDAAIQAGEAKR